MPRISRVSRQGLGQRYAAFLRAINVGGRRVSMDSLCEAFAGPGVTDVDTFLASGNVLFRTVRSDTSALEPALERRLTRNLGFPVDAFVRSVQEITDIIAAAPFDAEALETSQALNVGFVRDPLTTAARQALDAMTTEIDRFAVIGREVYWLCQRRQSESTFSNVAMERALGVRATFRSMSTISKLHGILHGER
jgi:uncharacterized protein (DUF1697 family)